MVNLEAYKDFIAVTATVSTMLQFLTGMQICMKIRKKGSTGDISAFSFVCGCLGCSLWLRYALLIQDFAMISVNLTGLVLQGCYLIFYYTFCLHRGVVNRQILGLLTIIVTTIYYADYYETDIDISLNRLGIVACSASLMFCAAPLSSMAQVMRQKSTDCLPFPLILATFIVSLQWLLYGHIINDRFVQVPNMIGSLLSGFQLSLFVYFSSSKQHVS